MFDALHIYSLVWTEYLISADLPRTVERITLHIVHKINELDLLPGRSTVSVAAATIYMASLVSRTLPSCDHDQYLFQIVNFYRLFYPFADKWLQEACERCISGMRCIKVYYKQNLSNFICTNGVSSAKEAANWVMEYVHRTFSLNSFFSHYYCDYCYYLFISLCCCCCQCRCFYFCLYLHVYVETGLCIRSQ